MEDTTQALTVYDGGTAALDMVRPLVTPADAKRAIQAYEMLKSAIIQPGDVQKIQGRDFLKKSFWRRVATCFGLSLELVSEARGFDEGNRLFYSVVYRALAPNGRSMIGDGYCSTAEKGREMWPEHNVRATAHTRAKNRAISDLVGGGEVSAEELPDFEDAPAQPQRPAPRPTQLQRGVTVRPADPGPDARQMMAQQRTTPAMAKTAGLNQGVNSDTPLAAIKQGNSDDCDWVGLRKRLKDCGVRTMADADEVTQRAVHKTWEACNDTDYPQVSAEVKKMEAKHASAAAKVVDAANVDLADLPPVAMVP